MSRIDRLAGDMNQFFGEFERFLHGDNRKPLEKIRDWWHKTKVYRAYKLLRR